MLGSKSTTFESCIGHMKRVRYSMERFVFLPFSIAGCGSDSSVATGKSHQSREEDGSETKDPHGSRREVAEQSKPGAKIETYSGSWSLPKPNIAARMQRLIRGIKSFSKIFAYKEEDDEEEMEMEIGFPTDVKHVTHIGLDGLTRNNVAKVLDDVRDPAEVNFMATISLDEYEMAMAAQARPTLVV